MKLEQEPEEEELEAHRHAVFLAYGPIAARRTPSSCHALDERADSANRLLRSSRLDLRNVAERAGFEPAVRRYRTLAFQASAFDRSATSPLMQCYSTGSSLMRRTNRFTQFMTI